MMPRTILPNVVMDNLGLDVKFYINGWEMIGFMIGVGLIFAGLTIFADWFDLDRLNEGVKKLNEKNRLNKKELGILKKGFAIMSREYTDEIVKLKGKNK